MTITWTLYIVTNTLQTSHKVQDIDIVFYLHNVIMNRMYGIIFTVV